MLKIFEKPPTLKIENLTTLPATTKESYLGFAFNEERKWLYVYFPDSPNRSFKPEKGLSSALQMKILAKRDFTIISLKTGRKNDKELAPEINGIVICS